MDSTALIWIIVAIVVLLAIVIAALLMTARGRREHRLDAQHDRAEKMRSSARDTALEAREHEAELARARADSASAAAAAERARADAAQASLAAERRAGDIDQHADDAARLRSEQAETLRRADEVDPYVDADSGGPVGSAPTTRRDAADGRASAPSERDADAARTGASAAGSTGYAPDARAGAPGAGAPSSDPDDPRTPAYEPYDADDSRATSNPAFGTDSAGRTVDGRTRLPDEQRRDDNI